MLAIDTALFHIALSFDEATGLDYKRTGYGLLRLVLSVRLYQVPSANTKGRLQWLSLSNYFNEPRLPPGQFVCSCIGSESRILLIFKRIVHLILGCFFK